MRYRSFLQYLTPNTVMIYAYISDVTDVDQNKTLLRRRMMMGSTILGGVRATHNIAHKVLIVEHLASPLPSQTCLLWSTTKSSSSCISIQDRVYLRLCQDRFTRIGIRMQKCVAQFSNIYLPAVVIIEGGKGI